MESESRNEAYGDLQNYYGSSSSIGNRTYDCRSWEDISNGTLYQELNMSPTVIPQRFSGSSLIDFLHDATPRFGKPSNITAFIVGESQDGMGYILGLVYFALMIFCIFLVWCLLLFFFRLRGPTVYGWLSGSRMVFPPKPDIKEEQNIEQTQKEMKGSYDSSYAWHDKYTKRTQQNSRMKLVAGLACAGIVVAEVLMLVFGVPGLHRALGNALDAIDMALSVTSRGLQVLNQLVTFGESTAVVVDGLIAVLQDMKDTCPTRESLLQSLCIGEHHSDCIGGSDWFESNEIYNSVISYFEDVDEYLIWELHSIEDFFIGYQEWLLLWQGTFQHLTWVFAVALVAALLLLCITVGLILSMVLVRSIIGRPSRLWKCFRCSVVPVFFMLVVISFGFAIGFVLAAVSLSDACHGDIDGRMFRIVTVQLENSGLPFNEYADEVLHWYLSQCEREPRYELERYLWKGSGFLADLSVEIENGALEDLDFDGFCNRTVGVAATNNFTSISDSTALLVDGVSDGLCQMAGLSLEVRSLFACTTFYPLYTAIIHESMCGSVDEFAWVAMTQAAVVLMAMIVLTLRVVIYQDVAVKEFDKILSTEKMAEEVNEIIESASTLPAKEASSESHSGEQRESMISLSLHDAHDFEKVETSGISKDGEAELQIGDWLGHIDFVPHAVSSQPGDTLRTPHEKSFVIEPQAI